MSNENGPENSEEMKNIGERLENVAVEDERLSEGFEDAGEEREENVLDEDYVDELALKDREISLNEDEIEKMKDESLTYKAKGNELFKVGNFTEARSCYTTALRNCPLKFDQERSVLFANRGACNMKENRKEKAIEDCTKALELNPNYLKAIKRRAVLYEETDKFDESLADFKNVLELDKTDREAIEAIQRLPGKINERNEKLKEQMLGSLKEIGNKILRPFGLSTENFKLQQDPNSGSYTINFNQGK